MTKWLAVAVSVVVLLSPCAGAQAKEFRVYTCTTPDLQPLGPTIGYPSLPSGWDFSWSGDFFATIDDLCPFGNRFAFRVHGGGPITTGQGIWVRWTAAPGTQLTGVSSSWAANSDLSPNRGEGTAQLTAATDRQTLFAQDTPLSVAYGVAGTPSFQPPLSAARWFEIRYTCLDRCSTTLDPALYAYVLSAQFDVDDSSPPVGGLVGSATDAQTWSGSMRFGLNAADVGAGLARTVVEVDGVDVLAVPVSDARGTCRDVGSDPGVAEYAAAQPCPLRVDDATVDVDTARLPQGEHVVRVVLEDAAGNRATVFGPLTRTIAASGAIGPGSDRVLRGAGNGAGASDQARLTAHWGRRSQRTFLVSPFGRAHVARGRLTSQDGVPIVGAAIDVVSRTTAVNARALAKRVGPRSGGDGSWYVVLPRGVSSRDVTFGYRSHVNDTVASATAGLRLRVRAGVRLAIHPRRARMGQAIRFRGRLLGGPLPRGGKLVVLMARASRGAWVRFNVVRSDLRGRFDAVYRFQQPGTALYRFRALSLAEAAYPYLAGGSNVVTVRKR